MSLSRYTEPFTYPDGRPAAGVAVTVYHHATSTKAILYNDSEGTSPQANPVVTDVAGMLDFYIEAGFYDLSANGELFGAYVGIAAENPDYVAPVVHTQVTPSTSWVFNHQLGIQYPDVEVFVGSVRHYPAIDYNVDVATISFPLPATGVAIARR